MVATEKRYRVIGTSPVRPDGTDKVTGRAEYGADIRPKGMLYGAVLRSPHAHARIESIDASRALAMDGVHAVITAADFPDLGNDPVPTIRGPVPASYAIEHIIASRTALFRGHPVAAVAATDPHLAEDAIAAIEVKYELLRPVLSIDAGLEPDAPILHDNSLAASIDGLFDPVDGRETNVARRVVLQIGDIEAGFAEADVIVEREFETASTHQGYIEPQNATAYWDHEGRLIVWTSTQGAFGVRQQLVELLKIPYSRIRVVPMEIGGGFGGKIPIYLEPLAAMLARHSGRPVQLTMSRAEVFEASGPTSATRSRVRIGAKRDGTITAAEGRFGFESGAFPGAPVAGGARCALSPYAIANQYVEGFEVVVNKPKTAAYRAPGAPQTEFAVESVLDELAEQLGIDPLEFRLKNAASEGSLRAEGVPHGVIGHREVLVAAQGSAHYRSELHGEYRGRGVASGFWFNAGGESSAYATMNPDGTVSLVTGSVDIGGQRAGLAMQFAETMGIEYDRITSTVGDTDSIGFTGNTGGSRTSFATGWAVYEAAMDLRAQIEERVARIWELDRESVSYGDDGDVTGPGDRSMSFAELAARLPATGGMLQGRADVRPMAVGPALAAHICDVEVDPDTGKVTILRYTAIQDVGKAIHPAYVEGQIQGGVAQGIGIALNEEYVFDDEGRMLNASFLDYRMPTTLDLPEIETILVEVPNPGHPYGVRGVGEVPIVPPLAAVANAIFDATGVRVRRLPASPRYLLERMLDAAE